LNNKQDGLRRCRPAVDGPLIGDVKGTSSDTDCGVLQRGNSDGLEHSEKVRTLRARIEAFMVEQSIRTRKSFSRKSIKATDGSRYRTIADHLPPTPMYPGRFSFSLESPPA
jgi:hypothetical protein